MAGCAGDGGSPSTLPTLTASAPSTTTPTSTPTGFAAPTPEGAAAFARHWIDVLNIAAASGRTTELRKLGAPGCRACDAFAESIDAIWKNGSIQGGVFKVRFAEAPKVTATATVGVFLQYSVSSTKHLDRQARVVKSVPARSNITSEMVLARSGPNWLVREFTVQS